MIKLYLKMTPELFQGKKFLTKKKNYFEGWYFKNTSNDYSISFIPGISINKEEQIAFIQVITKDSSYFVEYSLDDFCFCHKPFYIKIKNNFFSKEKINIDIEDKTNNLEIKGCLNYSDILNIKTSLFNPNIMGPFSYIPFMECNHAIIAMNCKISGTLTFNNQIFSFDNGKGYIEKDFGTSFPKSYIWCEGNNFSTSNASFMCSVASIDFKLFNFRGTICSLIIDDKEYKFTTYNHTKLIKFDITDNFLNIELRKKNYFLSIKSESNDGFKLIAPVNGQMKKEIIENINATLAVTLRKKDEIIFSDSSTMCGIEIVL